MCYIASQWVCCNRLTISLCSCEVALNDGFSKAELLVSPPSISVEVLAHCPIGTKTGAATAVLTGYIYAASTLTHFPLHGCWFSDAMESVGQVLIKVNGTFMCVHILDAGGSKLISRFFLNRIVRAASTTIETFMTFLSFIITYRK